ncbi:MAG TPA: hypothetical protein VNQ73_21700 [Ilumatobacter sp.]|nr:hypothetical protein [Ilumatobacter sp.]
MSRRSSRVTLVALVALAATGLTACGASAPPAKELAVEVVDSLLADGLIDADEADCMRSKVAEYTGDALDNIAERANNNDANALEALEQFEADLADCRAAG